MRRLLLLALLLVPVFGIGQVDTRDGTAITTATTIDSVSTMDTADGQAVTAGASCSTQSLDQNATTDNNDKNFLTTHARGQSFPTTAFGGGTKDVHRILIRLATGETANPNIALRFDDDTDMSSEYMGGEATGTCSGAGECTLTFPSGNRPSVSQSTTYYFFMHTDVSMSTGIDRNLSGGSWTYYFDNTSAVWTGLSTTASTDLYFKVYLCD
ncbi:hypothetical protein LCGC14_2304900 [marine sediment metagenome]|uniref:Uncharacterized protein n=1 Tax=marine sediment metagenome TaxID=412755 RepID=A0A0F9FHA4_9ZZZZ